MPEARIRNRIRALREADTMTQADLALRCGCTRQTIIMLEQERYVPSLSLAFAVARALGVKIEDVLEPNAPPPAGRARPAARGDRRD